MGITKKIVLALFILAVAFSYQAYHDLSKPFERPEIGKHLMLSNDRNNLMIQVYLRF